MDPTTKPMNGVLEDIVGRVADHVDLLGKATDKNDLPRGIVREVRYEDVSSDIQAVLTVYSHTYKGHVHKPGSYTVNVVHRGEYVLDARGKVLDADALDVLVYESGDWEKHFAERAAKKRY